jgi:hypothetical protein
MGVVSIGGQYSSASHPASVPPAPLELVVEELTELVAAELAELEDELTPLLLDALAS